MSAEDRWHKQAPVKGVDPIISATILLRLQGQRSTEQSALPWQADLEDAFRLEPAPDGSCDSEEVFANLLRAIENTDIAARLQNVALQSNGHPSTANSAGPVETGEAAAMLREPPAPDAGCSESTSAVTAESNEALTNLLRAIQSTDVAATLERIPQAECAEHAGFVFTQPAANAETPTTVPQAPETDAFALPTAALEAPETGESSAVLMHDIQSIDAGLLDSHPTEGGAEHSDIASSGPIESAKSTSISELPVARPHHAEFREQGRKPRRVSRRRNSSRQRSDYLLSIAAPAIVAPRCPAAGEPESTQASEPLEPSKAAAPPLEVVARTVAEPEKPSTAEPEAIADAPGLPAATGDFAPKTPIFARLGTEIKSLAAAGDLINVGLDRAEMRLENWFQRWFGPLDPRRSTRVDKPPLVAYHWIVDTAQALKIADISAGGLHLVTNDRWSEGNIVSMTLQRTDKEKGSPESWIAVDFLVMRWCEDGMAGAFMPSTPGLVHTVAGRAGNCADKKTLERFVDRLVDAAARRAAATN